MTGNPQRKDAARNWQHIVDTARRFVDDGVPLRLNDVARAASIGVATVYRHFPVPEALLETVAQPALTRLAADADAALTETDPWKAFADFLKAGIDAQLTDASVQPVFATSSHTLPETTELVARLHTSTGDLLARASAAETIRPGVTREDVIRLMCGVVFAASVHAHPDERPTLTRTYLEIVLTGLRLPT
ncbi:TetR/AcrR family transcriptional regulator [Actinoplanes couchii]|uniref:TetR family transcriptional regulator n=1 Tax=Actinoplanes couchii TaxID=403638 RepID=A0ABQ3X263_9ACTN|nr:TetR/AcrR family transcriptional regulator [Actinoplanes couchii]MDR6317001.1 AcrR family transcriptional regulator [Actinoplanes couchii]GID52609.1 TetR family transcriptional regulator [Actinoplanes couchii]